MSLLPLIVSTACLEELGTHLMRASCDIGQRVAWMRANCCVIEKQFWGCEIVARGSHAVRDLALSHGLHLGLCEILAKWVAAGVRVIAVGE